MKITSTFIDKTVSKRIETIVNAVYYLLKDILNEPPLGEKNIELIHDDINGPIVLYPLEPDKYKIGLNINGDFPLQIIYQVAHELCHIFIDPRINGLFIEIICHKTALDILEIHGLQYFQKDEVEKHIKEIRDKSSLKYNVDLTNIDLDWLRNSYRKREFNNTILDREFNNIAAFELKKQTDNYGKFGIIKHIRNSLKDDIKMSQSDLSSTMPYTKMDFEKLASNINSDLGQIIKTMLK